MLQWAIDVKGELLHSPHFPVLWYIPSSLVKEAAYAVDGMTGIKKNIKEGETEHQKEQKEQQAKVRSLGTKASRA